MKMLQDYFLETGAVKKGEFLLSSGKTSDIYVDCRLLTLHSRAQSILIPAFIELLDSAGIRYPSLIGGPVVGAVPIVSALLHYYSYINHVLCRAFLVRSEPKSHGLQKPFEGHIPSGEKAILFDDVATSGKSLLHCAEEVWANNSEVVGAFVIVDRKEGAKEFLDKHSIPLYSLTNLATLRSLFPE
jgi:orotate phosphoribosyltransferase